ncbi:MAG: ornithine carbamoyltransferase [Dehalococcoidales bacterium]|nr:ornithine carbamoyltransferase [Dehalococcoidales bacterium]
MEGKDFLSVADLTREDIRRLIYNAVAIKAEGWSTLLSTKVLVLMFEKPSTRTRVSFDVGMRQLGGYCLYLSPEEVGLGKRESPADVARVLSRYANAIAARTFSHQTVVTLARYADIPVINALSDLEHPCQALADVLTIHEHKGNLEGLTLAYIGDGNNCANSLMLAAALSGMNFRIASPRGYEVDIGVLQQAQKFAAENDAEIFCTNNPQQAAADADIVYTDVWASMGQEAEAEERRAAFAEYQVDDNLLSLAKNDAILMHPLPAHHGEEVAENIIYCPQSVVFDQAENRLHAQKALLAEILGGLEIPLPDY